LKVETPLGFIEVKVSPAGEVDYPGIWINIGDEGLVLVEYDSDLQKHVIRVWDHKDPDNDPVYRQVIEEEE
jgi:hypothetical protein